MGIGIRKTAQGIRNPANDCNLEFQVPAKEWPGIQ